MPHQYLSPFQVRVLALLDEGRRVTELVTHLGIAAATLYRWRYQARIDAGTLPGTTSEDAAELANATRRIRSPEKELQAPKLATSMLKVEGIGPQDISRTR